MSIIHIINKKNGKKYTFSENDILSFGMEHPEKYIGQKGFFGDSLFDVFGAIVDGNSRTLKSVGRSVLLTHFTPENEDSASSFFYFLPESLIKITSTNEDSIKLVPFSSFGEFCASTDSELFSTLYIRSKANTNSNNKFRYSLVPVMGYTRHIDDSIVVDLGNHSFSFKELCDGYEYSKDLLSWHPFGKEVRGGLCEDIF